MAGLPPVVRLAMAFAAGSALTHPGVRLLAPLLALLVLAPIRASLRPSVRRAWILVAVAGAAAGFARGHRAQVCDLAPQDGQHVRLVGRALAEGPRAVPFEVRRGGCRNVIRVAGEGVPLGRRVALNGRWQAWQGGYTLQVASAANVAEPRWRGVLIRWRGHLVRRLHVLYPDHGGVVAGLVLARKEGLAPEVRDAFARSGIAHLLAISGFHVGVVAGLLVLLLRILGVGRRTAGVLAALGSWGYVTLIGFPGAACRAALILSAMAVSRARGRPPARVSALGAALLVLVAWDPRSLFAAGFQLSFAGAGALSLWGRPLASMLQSGPGRRLPRGVATALAAGIAATLGTLPVVAWHFERVSLVGIPVTLVASPLVALALPGALVSLALDVVSPSAASVLAGGVWLLLELLTASASWVAGHAWASVWVPRTWVVVGSMGACLGLAWASRLPVRGRIRRAVAVLSAACAIVIWPLMVTFEGRGRVEVRVLDVGQGDAVALRTPRGRWILVDAGPPARSPEDGAQPVVRALRRMGVTRIELLVLTHPDLDHIGGAAAVLRSFSVRAVMDPGLSVGKGAYLDVLEQARRSRVPWTKATAGTRLEVDGLALRVLHPDAPLDGSRGGSDPGWNSGSVDANDVSVVLQAGYGAFDVLLTGDAPAEVERRFSERLEGRVEVLKVAHHGSMTSTDSLMLWRVDPQVALLSVGRGNRFGHPAPSVLNRLERAGVPIYRTDRDGSIVLRATADGRFTVEVEGPGRR